MADADVRIEFEGQKTAWQPNERLSGRYRLAREDASNIERQELSVLWYTSGKGDEDLKVHSYQEWRSDSPDWTNPRDWKSFDYVLPPSPLSYDGVLIKIHWCVRVRYFAVGGTQILGEAPFQLGDVARGERLTA